MTAGTGADGRAAGVRDRAYLDFVRDRTLAWMAEHQSDEPLLGEAPARQPKACPKPGHEGLMVARSDYGQRCGECERLRKTARRRGERDR